MHCAQLTDNNAGITYGGVRSLYKSASIDIYRISTGSRGSILATARDASRPKEWKFPSECHVEQSIIDAAGKSEILAKLLVRRGLRMPGEVEAFLDPAKFVPSDPSEFSDTPRAVARIMQAIASKEKITVYGDYDVDGVTATAV